jgi:hypothetical protein
MGILEASLNRAQSAKRKLFDYNLIFSIFCFLTSTTVFLLLLFLPPSDRVCIAQSVVYRRAAEAINYEWVNFGDYMYPSSVYRHASSEQDPAWAKLMSRMLKWHLKSKRIWLIF